MAFSLQASSGVKMPGRGSYSTLIRLIASSAISSDIAATAATSSRNCRTLSFSE